MLAQAAAERPRECCGLLAGSLDGIITNRFPIGNVAASDAEYETSAADLFVAFRAMRTANLELLAIYHSHPTSAAIPSAKDLARNTYGETVAHVIVGKNDLSPDVRAWWLSPTDYRPCEWCVV
jgi:proteasome lid subunit RPN8/RPN11